jgi:hypothetical protein
MKKYISFLMVSVLVFSCKKQRADYAPPPVRNDHKELLYNVNAYLKKTLFQNDLALVDSTSIILSKQQDNYYIRVGLLNKKIETDFILLQADSVGYCSTGKFVHIQRDTAVSTSFNGRIFLESLRRDNAVKKVIANNAVTLQCEQTITPLSVQENIFEDDDGCDLVPSCDGCLPLVVVIGIRNSGGGGNGGLSFAEMISLSGILGSSTPAANGSGSSSAGGSSSSTLSGIYSPVSFPKNASGAAVKISNDLVINFETSFTKPAIDVNAFMKCFASVPDAGANCSITIFTDLPVDDNPDYIFNILGGATGHCFLQLSKSNGTRSVTQIIGKTTSKALAILAFPVQGKIIDNAAHKYNASLTMDITPVQLQTEIDAIIAVGSKPQYDIWENNCVDYATGIFNKIRPANPLTAVPFTDPDTGDLYSTPQGLYLTLDQMKKNGGAEAKNITTNIKMYAGTSHGACN